MNLRTWLNRDKSLALVAATALGIAGACTDLTDPGQHRLGNPAPELALDLAAAGGVPQGPLLIESFRLVVDTAGQTDVFQRAGADGYHVGTEYQVHTGQRIAGEDPRLPALAPLYAPEEFSADFARIMGPEYWGSLMWDFYMRWYGAEPGKVYTYSIERLATIVNGAPDALEFMIEGEVTQPDQLVPLDGTPGGYPANDYSWTTSAGCRAEPIPDPPPNPWYLGPVTANTSGRITPDFCMGTPWLWYQAANVPDSSVVALNELRLGITPEYQYNYIVVYEGVPPNLGPPVIRVQVGVDLDSNGNPMPNGFAPFPLEADRLAASTLPGVATEPSRIRFEIRDLEPLDGGIPYELWLVNQADGSSAPATADYFTIETIIETDEFGQQVEVDVPSADTVRTSTFAGLSQANVRHAFIASNRTLDGPTLGEFTHVTLAKPGTSGAATDPVMWADWTESTLNFGRLDMVDPPGSRLFRGTGSGDGLVFCEASQSIHDNEGNYLGEECLENQASLNLQFRRLRRPPPGYVYEVWLVGESVDPLSLGTITGPKPGYDDIDDADEVVNEAFMTETEILQAAKVVPFEILDLSQYNGVLITLEAKAGVAAIGPTTTLSGGLPSVCTIWWCGN